MPLKRQSVLTIATVTATTLALMFGVWLILAKTTDRVIQKEAETSATHWVSYFQSHLNDIETLIASGVPNEEQSVMIDTAIEFGEVFRFKLFRPDGTISLVSDEYKFKQEGMALSDVNTKAVGVFKTGISYIETGDGRQKPNRPDVYVESYVPIYNIYGDPIGVVEVYVDQTHMAASLVDNFGWIALFLPAFCAIFYLLPTVALLKKATIIKAAKAEAEQLANFDALTGLHNRRSFNKSAETCFNRHSTVGTLFIDIDNFKRINDEHGHDGGDAFLRSVGHTLQSKLGKDAIFARFGGDEFVACIGGVTPDELQFIAQDVLETVAKGTSHRGQTITGHVSIGLNVANSDEPLSDMLRAADTALYKSKNEGKNTITFFSDELNNEYKRQRKLEKLLTQAVDGTGLELFFQPINQPSSKKILGFEALLRMRDEHGEMILPEEFIPMAERLGLINEIGKWVLRQAVSTAKDWPKDIFISVNLSAVQFESGDLPRFIKDLLLEQNFPASQLEVEITESLLIGDDGSTQKQLAAIKALGVSIAMDDFGTGYSSLGYLWKYEFDKLKIDRSFLLGYDKEPEKLAKVIASVVDLGHGIDMFVTVEGVESEEHAKILKDMGCDQVQGYHFGKPMTIADAQTMISNESLNSLIALQSLIHNPIKEAS